MAAPRGRKPGLVLYAPFFEFAIASRGLLKKDVAEAAGISRQFLTDLLAPRGGTTADIAADIAAVFDTSSITFFPQLLHWTPPPIDRGATRARK